MAMGVLIFGFDKIIYFEGILLSTFGVVKLFVC